MSLEYAMVQMVKIGHLHKGGSRGNRTVAAIRRHKLSKLDEQSRQDSISSLKEISQNK